MEQPAGLPAYRAVAAAARLSLPTTDIAGSFSPDVGDARRLSEPSVVWPCVEDSAVPLSLDALYDGQFRANTANSERRPTVSAESCGQHYTPTPRIIADVDSRDVADASLLRRLSYSETVFMPSVLKTPVAPSAHIIGLCRGSAANSILIPQQGEGSPPETRGSSQQTRHLLGSSRLPRDGSQPMGLVLTQSSPPPAYARRPCGLQGRATAALQQAPWVPPSSSSPHRGGELARSLPRQLELPTSAAYDGAQQGTWQREHREEEEPSARVRVTSFRNPEREAAANDARARGEWARPPPDRPTLASSGWAHSKVNPRHT